MNVLSIQSRVAFGHVGNAAAAFPLQRLGIEVWAVDTVFLSNHRGYRRWSGRARSPEEVAEIVEGLERLGVLGGCDAVLSGYLELPAMAEVVRSAVERVRRANPGAIYLCDPVMGDRERGLFVDAALPESFAATLVPAADIVIPNAFELERLTGLAVGGPGEALAAADRLRTGGGPAAVVVTGLVDPDAEPPTIAVLATDATGAWLAGAPLRPAAGHGAGDAFAALFLGHYLRERALDRALGRAVAAMDAVMAATAAADAAELRILAAQDQLAAGMAAVTRLG